MYVVPFRELGIADVSRVGGKAAHLGDLTQAGFPVPPGFAITTDAVGKDVEADILEAYAHLGDEPAVAVRSSALAEDAAGASFAGMHSTYLWLRGADEVLTGVRQCWASYDNPEAIAYRAQHGGAAGMSVAVQLMVDARVAGVLFTLNPVTGDPSLIAIEASYGVGETLVSGEVTPDSYLFSKVTRELVRSQIGSKEIERVGRETREVEPERRARPCLEPDEVARLAELGREVERHYGRPQDLEWAIDRDGTLFLLQARPETVWAQKAKPAVADSALAAIAATYSGGRPKR